VLGPPLPVLGVEDTVRVDLPLEPSEEGGPGGTGCQSSVVTGVLGVGAETAGLGVVHAFPVRVRQNIQALNSTPLENQTSRR